MSGTAAGISRERQGEAMAAATLSSVEPVSALGGCDADRHRNAWGRCVFYRVPFLLVFFNVISRPTLQRRAERCRNVRFIGHELDTLSAISFSLRKRNDARCRTSASNSRRRTARSRASTYQRPDDASRSRAAPGGAKAQFQKGWDAWKAWVKLEEITSNGGQQD
jgi:hypothetical protein